jgi:hypothetical protein
MVALIPGHFGRLNFEPSSHSEAENISAKVSDTLRYEEIARPYPPNCPLKLLGNLAKIYAVFL